MEPDVDLIEQPLRPHINKFRYINRTQSTQLLTEGAINEVSTLMLRDLWLMAVKEACCAQAF